MSMPSAQGLFHRAIIESGAVVRVETRGPKGLGVYPVGAMQTYRKSHTEASPCDLYILIASAQPRGIYAREPAKRKAAQGAAPAYLYRFDWETPEGGGHMRSPHTI